MLPEDKEEDEEKAHWCFRNFNHLPIWLVVHIIIFCIILYSGYVCWASVVLFMWDEYCNKANTHFSYGYVLVSIICLVLTMSSACYVGFYVGEHNLGITILAVSVDLVTLAMTVWGIILYFHRNQNSCGHKYAVQAPSFFIFFNATFGFWIFHFAVVAMLINCLGHLRLRHYSRFIGKLEDLDLSKLDKEACGTEEKSMILLERLDSRRKNDLSHLDDLKTGDGDDIARVT